LRKFLFFRFECCKVFDEIMSDILFWILAAVLVGDIGAIIVCFGCLKHQLHFTDVENYVLSGGNFVKASGECSE